MTLNELRDTLDYHVSTDNMTVLHSTTTGLPLTIFVSEDFHEPKKTHLNIIKSSALKYDREASTIIAFYDGNGECWFEGDTSEFNVDKIKLITRNSRLLYKYYKQELGTVELYKSIKKLQR